MLKELKQLLVERGFSVDALEVGKDSYIITATRNGIEVQSGVNFNFTNSQIRLHQVVQLMLKEYDSISSGRNNNGTAIRRGAY